VDQTEGFTSNLESSPDRNRVAFDRMTAGHRNIWTLEPVRKINQRFTFTSADDIAPVWSPDGSRIVFASNRTGVYNLFWKSSTSNGNDELLLESSQSKFPMDWSSDGRFILYRVSDSRDGLDLWVLPLFGDRMPFAFVKTAYDERDGKFSPNVRWVAYQSNESGHYEIYVQPFPGPGREQQVSNKGGTQPRWNSDGKELFYVAADGKLMSVSVETSNGALDFKPPVELFPTHILEVPSQKQQYVVSPNGQEFLLNAPTDIPASPINIILNWHGGPAARENR